MKHLHVVPIMIAGLSACGGGGADGAPDAEVTQERVIDEDRVTVDPEQIISVWGGRVTDLDESNNAVTFLVTQTDNLNVDTLFDFTVNADETVVEPPGFTAFKATGGILVRGVTKSGAGMGQAFALDPPDGRIASIGSFIQRPDDTSYITLGTARFTGDYMGVYRVSSNGNAPAGHIVGLAEYEIDFEAGTSFGSIKEQRNTGTETLEDIMLMGMELDDGKFSGRVQGGEFSRDGFSTNGFFYEGLIVGPQGDEVIGKLSLGHEKDGKSEFIEYGIFTGAGGANR